MKVVILAAGLGSRLTGSGEQPKALVHLPNGKSLLAMQLEAISCYLSLDQVIVVVGHHKEAFFDQFPDLLYVYNPSYAGENTAKSLLRAARKVDEDLLWINGDLLFHPTVLGLLLENEGGNAMVTNHAAVGEEEVKYRTDGTGLITAVSKNVTDGEGEAIGLNLFSRHDLPLLCDSLAACRPNDYFEKAVELSIDRGAQVLSVPVSNDLCIEIDFPEDLVAAAALVEKWQL